MAAAVSLCKMDDDLSWAGAKTRKLSKSGGDLAELQADFVVFSVQVTQGLFFSKKTGI